MEELHPFAVLDATSIDLEIEAVAANQIVHGKPTTGWRPISRALGLEIGIWEMSAGAMTDIETDEVFVVVSGRATVVLRVDGGPSHVLALRPGSICRLSAGSRTLWEVHEPLRKVVVLGADDGEVSL